jgi:hypothetical protein
MKRTMCLLPKYVFREIQRYYEFFDSHFDNICNRLADVVDGSRKERVTDWWLRLIDEKSKSLLREKGFVEGAVPYNYLDEPPSDLAIVSNNLEIVTQLMSGSDFEVLRTLISQVTSEIYREVDLLIAELEFVLKLQVDDVINPICDVSLPSDHQRMSLQNDLDYLKTMKVMDEEIRQRELDSKIKVEMSQVVPIGGLIMARFHILECELRTTLFQWNPSRLGSRPSARRKSVLLTDYSHEDDFVSQEVLSAKVEAEAKTGAVADYTFDSTKASRSSSKRSSEIDRLLHSRMSHRSDEDHGNFSESSSQFKRILYETCPPLAPVSCVEMMFRRKRLTKFRNATSSRSESIRVGDGADRNLQEQILESNFQAESKNSDFICANCQKTQSSHFFYICILCHIRYCVECAFLSHHITLCENKSSHNFTAVSTISTLSSLPIPSSPPSPPSSPSPPVSPTLRFFDSPRSPVSSSQPQQSQPLQVPTLTLFETLPPSSQPRVTDSLSPSPRPFSHTISSSSSANRPDFFSRFRKINPQ